MAVHDENKDVRLVSKRCKISFYNKSIEATKGTIIGNRLWGRIDFLTNYCDWRFYWTTGSKPGIIDKFIENNESKRDIKKKAKEHTLTDKTKRKKK